MLTPLSVFVVTMFFLAVPVVDLFGTWIGEKLADRTVDLS